MWKTRCYSSERFNLVFQNSQQCHRLAEGTQKVLFLTSLQVPETNISYFPFSQRFEGSSWRILEEHKLLYISPPSGVAVSFSHLNLFLTEFIEAESNLMVSKDNLTFCISKLDFHCLFALQSQELIINSPGRKQTWIRHSTVSHSLVYFAIFELLWVGISSILSKDTD